jgi:hypothetical protein
LAGKAFPFLNPHVIIHLLNTLLTSAFDVSGFIHAQLILGSVRQVMLRRLLAISHISMTEQTNLSTSSHESTGTSIRIYEVSQPFQAQRCTLRYGSYVQLDSSATAKLDEQQKRVCAGAACHASMEQLAYSSLASQFSDKELE